MKKILPILLCVLSLTGIAQTTFYDINTVQKIEIFFSQSNWDYQLDTAKYGADDYVIADSVKINGSLFNTVGVKYKGNSSYDSTYIKNPLHLELDNVINQSYQGISDIKLSNGFNDPSLIREVLSYSILSNYMHASKANFTQVFINGVFIGLYTNVESVDKTFCSTHFFSSQNTFIKANPTNTSGPTVKSNLKYIPLADSSAYFTLYEMKSTNGWNDLLSLCDTITNFPTSVANNLNMDRVIWMLAFNSVLVNLDSYSGVFSQNYYLYKDNTNHFNPIVWDLNMSFGGFPFVGSSNSSMGTLSVANMQQLSPTIHSADPYWPLINVIMNNASYKKMYMAHIRTIANEFFANGNYISTATQLQTLIDTNAQVDTNMFFNYSQFQNGITTNQVVGSYTVPGISTLMNARLSYLQSNADYILVAPVIANVQSSNVSPILNDVISITAEVTNAIVSQVYLGYRYSAADNFVKTMLYDDGNHNDGIAGDFIYGASITVSALQMQYYIYAENADAAVFSPARAEHEFYSLQAQTPLPTSGQIAINEFVANNTSGITNEVGDFVDWIELYNNTNTSLSLYGLYLSDNFTTLTKYAFPSGTNILPHAVLTVYADELTTGTNNNLHATFKLSASGERLVLSDGASLVIDSLTFGVQNENVSWGRCPDGIGNFTAMVNPTFNALNCDESSVAENNFNANLISLFPNPASDKIIITSNKNLTNAQLNIINYMGQKIISKVTQLPATIDINDLTTGVYLVEIENGNSRWQQKLVVTNK